MFDTGDDEILQKKSEFTSEILNQEQINKVFDIIKSCDSEDPPKLDQITQDITGDTSLSGRNREGREIKRMFSLFGFDLSKSYAYRKKKFELSEEQKETIRINYQRFKKPLELVRLVFPEKELTNLSIEYKAVNKFLQENYGENLGNNIIKEINNTVDGDYKPPTTPLLALREVKKYVKDFDLEESKLELSKYRAMMTKMMHYLHDTHFLLTINKNFKDKDRRTLFLSTFVKYTYDKPDLTEEEREQYLTVATEAVISSDALEQISMFRDMISELKDDIGGEEQKNIRMNTVELLDKVQKSYNDSQKRSDTLLKKLTTARSDKLKTQKAKTVSLVQLVNYWKDEENRKTTLKLAKAREAKLREAHKDLASISNLHAELWGWGSEDDVVSG